MSKGGYDVDTSGMQASANKAMGLSDQEAALAGEAAQMARQNYAQGQGMYTMYKDPIMREYLKIVGLGAGAGSPESTNPLLSKLLGSTNFESNQAATAATKNLQNMNLGPIAQMTGKQNIDLTKMSNIQTGVMKNIQYMLDQLSKTGDEGLAMQTGAPAAMIGAAGATGQAGQVALGAGTMESTIAKLQADAARSNNFTLMQGLQAIGSIGTLIGSGFGATTGAGQIFGKGGGGGAAGAASSMGSSGSSGTSGLDAYNPATSAYGDFGLGSSEYGAGSLAAFL